MNGKILSSASRFTTGQTVRNRRSAAFLLLLLVTALVAGGCTAAAATVPAAADITSLILRKFRRST